MRGIVVSPERAVNHARDIIPVMLALFTPQTRLRLAWMCLAVHVIAIAAMLLVVIHGLPPGDLSARRAFVATHAVSWGLGWLVWAFATLTLLLFFMAWADTLPHKGWALAAVGIAFVGGLVDWVNETIWVFLAPTWAAHAVAEPFYANMYALWDRAYVVLSIGLANLLYTLGGLLLTLITLRTKNFPRWLAGWSALVWGFSLALTYVGFAGTDEGIAPVSAGIFALFLPWLALMGHGWLVGVRPGATTADLRARLSFREVVRSIIPKHPLPMTTVFRECFLVNFAVQPDVMRRLLPGPIAPDLHDGEAFLSIVIADMERMRPAFLPKFMGVTYNQIVYRAVVRCHGEAGVHFLRSDADHGLMSLAGDWLTFFRFHHSRAAFRPERGLLHFDLHAAPAHHADIHASFDLARASRDLPPASKFKTLAEAQEFLVELFAAFAYDPLTEQVSTVRIQRGAWDIAVVEDRRAQYDFMRGSALFPEGSTRLDSIFYVKDLPYYWHTLETSPSVSREAVPPVDPTSL